MHDYVAVLGLDFILQNNSIMVMTKDMVIFGQNQISTYSIDRHTINQNVTEKRGGHYKCQPQENLENLENNKFFHNEIFKITDELELCYIDEILEDFKENKDFS